MDIKITDDDIHGFRHGRKEARPKVYRGVEYSDADKLASEYASENKLPRGTKLTIWDNAPRGGSNWHVHRRYTTL